MPANVKLGERRPVHVEVAETSFGQKIDKRYTLYAGKPSICTGSIDRASYNRKIAALKQQKAAGNITHSQFEDYQAQLVGCLK